MGCFDFYEQIGPDLIAVHKALQQIYLCINDFECLEVINKARQIGARTIPKHLCFLVESKET